MSLFIEKRASGETNRLKSTVTIVEKEGVSFAGPKPDRNGP